MPRAVTVLGGVVFLVLACAPAASPTDTPVRKATTAPVTEAPTPPAPTEPPTRAPTQAASPSPTVGGSPASPASSPASGPPSAAAWRELSVRAGPGAREDHTWTVDRDGAAAYLFGGRAGGRELNDLWRYDLPTDEWAQLDPSGTLPAARFGHTAVWRDGVGLVVWSGQAGTRFFTDIWAYDPATDAWQELAASGDVPPARYGSCAGIGPDGRMWISHGFTEDTGRFSDTRAYDFATGTWADNTPPGDRPVERCLHDCLWTPDGRLLVYAGQTTGAPAIGDLWTYDASAASWAEAPRPEPDPRQLYALAQVDGTAFVFGGGAADGSALNDLWQLDLATLGWSQASPAGSPPGARFGATLIADERAGRLLLFGGRRGANELVDLWEISLTP